MTHGRHDKYHSNEKTPAPHECGNGGLCRLDGEHGSRSSRIGLDVTPKLAVETELEPAVVAVVDLDDLVAGHAVPVRTRRSRAKVTEIE